MSAQTTEALYAIRARAIADARITAALLDLRAAREHLNRIPLDLPEVDGDWLAQAMTSLREAIGRLERIEDALDAR